MEMLNQGNLDGLLEGWACSLDCSCEARFTLEMRGSLLRHVGHENGTERVQNTVNLERAAHYRLSVELAENAFCL